MSKIVKIEFDPALGNTQAQLDNLTSAMQLQGYTPVLYSVEVNERGQPVRAVAGARSKASENISEQGAEMIYQHAQGDSTVIGQFKLELPLEFYNLNQTTPFVIDLNKVTIPGGMALNPTGIEVVDSNNTGNSMTLGTGYIDMGTGDVTLGEVNQLPSDPYFNLGQVYLSFYPTSGSGYLGLETGWLTLNLITGGTVVPKYPDGFGVYVKPLGPVQLSSFITVSHNQYLHHYGCPPTIIFNATYEEASKYGFPTTIG